MPPEIFPNRPTEPTHETFFIYDLNKSSNDVATLTDNEKRTIRSNTGNGPGETLGGEDHETTDHRTTDPDQGRMKRASVSHIEHKTTGPQDHRDYDPGHGLNNRKSRVPVGGEMVSVLFVPSSWIPLVTVLQTGVPRPLPFCCKTQPVEGEGQESATLLPARRMASAGGGGGGATAASRERRRWNCRAWVSTT